MRASKIGDGGGDSGVLKLEELGDTLETLTLVRGAVLMHQGDPAESFFFVVAGRFTVEVEGTIRPVAEIGAGQPIGEIAFLANGNRTATVTALRDSVVVRVTRDAFNELSRKNPAVLHTLTIALARRLSASNQLPVKTVSVPPRTIAIIRAGSSAIPPEFIPRLLASLRCSGPVLAVGNNPIDGVISPPKHLDTADAIRKLSEFENTASVIFIADETLTRWSEQTIRQADLVLAVGWHEADCALNPLERRAADLLSPTAIRLVLVHPTRKPIRGTAGWLNARHVGMHHHVAIDVSGDFQRLARFINGTAVGLVACGGGAYSAAHVGLYQALIEAGVVFDIMGGTSGGAAMTAAFAIGATPEAIDRAIHTSFVTNNALGHWTWPLYSLVDHTHFDRYASVGYAGIDIEDLWIPFFAISTNLSLHKAHRHSTGDVWEAVRASGSIPVMLPPYYNKNGHMLVDGAIVDNVPIRAMHAIKSGPNIVVNFRAPAVEKFAAQYSELPGRWSLLAQLMNPKAWRRLPQAPKIAGVLMRALMAGRQEFERHLYAEDLVLRPPLPPGVGVLDWHRHSDIKDQTYQWARSEFASLDAATRATFIPSATQH